jgi:ankyrin repeat protein
VVSFRGYNGDTPLVLSTRKRDLSWISFLLKRGADPNIGDARGDTPLIIASSLGFAEAASLMLGYGAKVDATNRQGETALAIAVQQRQPRIVEMLLKAGANPDKGDHVTGYTPRDYAKRDTRNPQILKLIENTKSTKKPSVAGPSIN